MKNKTSGAKSIGESETVAKADEEADPVRTPTSIKSTSAVLFENLCDHDLNPNFWSEESPPVEWLSQDIQGLNSGSKDDINIEEKVSMSKIRNIFGRDAQTPCTRHSDASNDQGNGQKSLTTVLDSQMLDTLFASSPIAADSPITPKSVTDEMITEVDLDQPCTIPDPSLSPDVINFDSYSQQTHEKQESEGELLMMKAVSEPIPMVPGTNILDEQALFNSRIEGPTCSIKKSQQGAPKKASRRSASGRLKSPSRFCHVCLRRHTRVVLFPCGNFFVDGSCTKSVCARCFETYGWDWNEAILNAYDWTCTHCRGVCPQRATCHIYNRTNERRSKRLTQEKAKTGDQKKLRSKQQTRF